MLESKRCIIRSVTALSALCLVPSAFCEPSKRPFTPADDVGLMRFNWYLGSEVDPGRDIKFSPDHRYFVIATQRGRLDLNAPEDTVWLFRTQDVEDFMQHPRQTAALLPFPLVTSALAKTSPN